MITVTARINISGDNGTLSSVTGTNFVGTNASSNISSVMGRKSANLGNPFILGSSKLGTSNYVAQVPYFIGRQLSDSNGNFQSSYTLTISGTRLKHIIIVFDNKNNAYPKSITIDGKTFVDDDPQWEIVFDNDFFNHTIEISNWSKPHLPLIISNIYADIDIEIDRSNLLSFDGSLVDRETIQNPSYGIVSNNASLTFIDKDEQALDLISQKVLHKGIAISIALNNPPANIVNEVANTSITKVGYDNDSNQVTLDLKDSLEQWQDIEVASIPYDFNDNTPKPFSQLYDYLRGYAVSNGFDMLSLDELDSETRFILGNVKLQYYILDGGSLWDCFQKFCEALLLHIYINEEGRVVCEK